MARRRNDARDDSTEAPTAMLTVTRRQVARYHGTTLAAVEEAPDGILVYRKRERGGKFDRHFYPWSSVISYLAGAGGKLEGGRSNPVHACVLDQCVLLSVVGAVTRDDAGGLLITDENDDTYVVPTPWCHDTVPSLRYLAEKPVATGDAGEPDDLPEEDVAPARPRAERPAVRRPGRLAAAAAADDTIDADFDEVEGAAPRVVDAFDEDDLPEDAAPADDLDGDLPEEGAEADDGTFDEDDLPDDLPADEPPARRQRREVEDDEDRRPARSQRVARRQRELDPDDYEPVPTRGKRRPAPEPEPRRKRAARDEAPPSRKAHREEPESTRRGRRATAPEPTGRRSVKAAKAVAAAPRRVKATKAVKSTKSQAAARKRNADTWR